MKKNKIIFLLVLLTLTTSVSAMEVATCGGVEGVPYGLLKFVGNVVKTVQIAVPIILVILGAVDFAKAMTSKEEKMSDSVKLFVKRVIYAILVFFVIAIVQFLFGMLNEKNGSYSCVSCMLGNGCDKSILKIESVTPGSPTSSDESKKVTKVKILSKKTKMKEEETFRITVAVYPETAKNRNVTYKSSKTSVAKIGTDGLITAVKKGTTTITVTSKGNKSAKASFKLTVKSKENNTTTGSGSTKLDGSVGKYGYFNQGSYSSTPFCGGGKTLQSSGCGAVSFAMVAHNLVDKSYNPVQVANYLCSHGHGGGALYEGWFTNSGLLNKFGLKSSHIVGNIGKSGNISDAKNKILKALNDGKMVVLYVPGHYVALGSAGKDKVTLLDPGRRANNGTYTIDSLWNLTSNYKNRCSSGGNCGWHGAYSFSKK